MNDKWVCKIRLRTSLLQIQIIYSGWVENLERGDRVRSASGGATLNYFCLTVLCNKLDARYFVFNNSIHAGQRTGKVRHRNKTNKRTFCLHLSNTAYVLWLFLHQLNPYVFSPQERATHQSVRSVPVFWSSADRVMAKTFCLTCLYWPGVRIKRSCWRKSILSIIPYSSFIANNCEGNKNCFALCITVVVYILIYIHLSETLCCLVWRIVA